MIIKKIKYYFLLTKNHSVGKYVYLPARIIYRFVIKCINIFSRIRKIISGVTAKFMKWKEQTEKRFTLWKERKHQLRKCRKEYYRAEISNEEDTFVLYRIIGNDLPPRHAQGQSCKNLQFILEHEPEFENCTKIWIINRIFDEKEKKKIVKLLKKHKKEFVDIPFCKEEYKKILSEARFMKQKHIKSNRNGIENDLLFKKVENYILCKKNLYVMNNNGARNVCLFDGRKKAKWILPWDGNCYLSVDACHSIMSAIKNKPWIKYFIVPMARILDNTMLLQQGFSPAADEEPQIIFRSDAKEHFNDEYPYGNMPKVELLKRLAVPGKWDSFPEVQVWSTLEKTVEPEKSNEKHQFAFCGWVGRLYSGNEEAEKNIKKRAASRSQSITDHISRIDKYVDES